MGKELEQKHVWSPVPPAPFTVRIRMPSAILYGGKFTFTNVVASVDGKELEFPGYLYEWKGQTGRKELFLLPCMTAAGQLVYTLVSSQYIYRLELPVYSASSGKQMLSRELKAILQSVKVEDWKSEPKTDKP